MNIISKLPSLPLYKILLMMKSEVHQSEKTSFIFVVEVNKDGSKKNPILLYFILFFESTLVIRLKFASFKETGTKTC